MEAIAREAPDLMIADMARPDRDMFDDIRHVTSRDRRLMTTASIGAALGAGTHCGSCLPEIREILRDTHADAA